MVIEGKVLVPFKGKRGPLIITPPKIKWTTTATMIAKDVQKASLYVI